MMQPTVAYVAWSVSLSVYVCISVGHECELHKNGCTDRCAVSIVDSSGPKKPLLAGRSSLGSYLSMPRPACS